MSLELNEKNLFDEQFLKLSRDLLKSYRPIIFRIRGRSINSDTNIAQDLSVAGDDAAELISLFESGVGWSLRNFSVWDYFGYESPTFAQIGKAMRREFLPLTVQNLADAFWNSRP